MPYTQEHVIGIVVYIFLTATAIMSASLLRGVMEAPDAGNTRYLRHPYYIPIEAREPFIYERP